MTTLAMKFGGTSVGSPGAHAQAANIVMEQAASWDRLAVVVSAMAGVTDALTKGARTAASGDDQTYRAVAADLRVRHYRAVDELLDPNGERAPLLATVDEYLDEFATFCHSVHVLGEVTPRAMDAITSLGERINARILAALLRQKGARSEAIDATELIVTDDKFQNAVPLMDATCERVVARLSPLLDEGVIPIVTGFIGATEEGVTTTLGRGGSDYHRYHRHFPRMALGEHRRLRQPAVERPGFPRRPEPRPLGGPQRGLPAVPDDPEGRHPERRGAADVGRRKGPHEWKENDAPGRALHGVSPRVDDELVRCAERHQPGRNNHSSRRAERPHGAPIRTARLRAGDGEHRPGRCFRGTGRQPGCEKSLPGRVKCALEVER